MEPSDYAFLVFPIRKMSHRVTLSFTFILHTCFDSAVLQCNQPFCTLSLCSTYSPTCIKGKQSCNLSEVKPASLV